MFPAVRYNNCVLRTVGKFDKRMRDQLFSTMAKQVIQGGPYLVIILEWIVTGHEKTPGPPTGCQIYGGGRFDGEQQNWREKALLRTTMEEQIMGKNIFLLFTHNERVGRRQIRGENEKSLWYKEHCAGNERSLSFVLLLYLYHAKRMPVETGCIMQKECLLRQVLQFGAGWGWGECEGHM